MNLLDFPQSGGRPNGSRCRDCWNEYKRAWRSGRPREIKPPGQQRKDQLKSRYGLTLEQFDAILEAQGGTCATCPALPEDSSRVFHVDHDHACCSGSKTCGRCVRGILCHNCNTTLGHAKDDVERLKNLVSYLEASRI